MTMVNYNLYNIITDQNSNEEHIILEIKDWLSTLIDASTPEDCIVKLCQKILNAYRDDVGNIKPPIVLNKLGKYTNIREFVLSNELFTGEAFLFPVIGGFKIKLKKIIQEKLNTPLRSRIRYSCAHEISHTFFYEINEDNYPRRAISMKSNYEEKLCDIGASEFLMPSDIFCKNALDFTKKNGYTCKTIVKLANKFKTSLQSITYRIIMDLPNNREGEKWYNYLGMRVDPVYGNDNKVSKFRVKWKVNNNHSILIPDIYEDNPLYNILLSKLISSRPRFGNQLEDTSFSIYGIPVSIQPLHIYEEGFLILIPIDTYFNISKELNPDRTRDGAMIIDFNFNEKKGSPNLKKIEVNKKLKLEDFL